MTRQRLSVFIFCALILIWPGLGTSALTAADIRVASKQHTESVLLTEVIAGLAESEGAEVEHLQQLGGTRVIWEAMLRGEVDAYVDYTGTLSRAILQTNEDLAVADLKARLAAFDIGMTGPLGFENSYAIGVSAAFAQATGVTDISDLAAYPGFRFGFSIPFAERADGWRGLKAAYNLPQIPQTVEHELGYRGLASGQLDGMDVYTTDPEIARYGVRVLEDDLGFFPDYAAVVLFRADLADRFPAVVEALRSLEGQIDLPSMRAMNEAASADVLAASDVARRFLEDTLGRSAVLERETRTDLLLRALAEHSLLVGVSLVCAIAVAVPLGIWAAWSPRSGRIILSASSVVQTIPSLALFVFMIPLLGIGAAPAIAALFIYSLLPIVRNTATGLTSLSGDVARAAAALGLGRWARLTRIDLPLARPMILAGIKTAAVINVGTATLGALIGAGGLGEPILIGIRLADTALILGGAVPAAVLALVVQGVFGVAESLLTPKGLKLAEREATRV